MYEDDPQEKVFDVLGSAVFGAHPLGRAIIGHASVIADTPADEIARFHASRYTPANIVIAAAGAVEHDAARRAREGARAQRRCRRRDGRASITPPVLLAPTTYAGTRRFERKDTEQFHVCVGGPGLSRHDDRRFALRVLDTIFGGTSSSRLFQEVRERYGLAYSVYSFTSAYEDSGQVGLYVGTRADNLGEAMRVIDAELARLRAEPGDRRGAGARQGEPQGPGAAGARVDRRAHEPARLRAAGRGAAARPRRGRRADRRRHAGRPRGAHRRAVGPERLSVAGIGPDEKRFERGARPKPAAVPAGMIRVAVSGAAGRMGSTICAAVEAADDMELVARIDPALGRHARRRPRRAPTRCARRLLDPDNRGREHPQRGRGRCARRRRHDRLRSGRDPRARGRQRVRRAELRDRRRADDAVRRAGRQAHADRRDHRAAPRPQARQAQRHRGADGRS